MNRPTQLVVSASEAPPGGTGIPPGGGLLAWPLRNFAAALGLTTEAVRLQMGEACAVDQATGAGLFSFSQAPARYQRELERIADERGYRNVERLLADAPHLPAASGSQRCCSVGARLGSDDLREFDIVAVALNGDAPLSTDGKKAVWLAAVQAYNRLTSSGASHRRTLSGIIGYLLGKPVFKQIARCALQKQISRSLRRWEAVERDVQQFLKDGRSGRGLEFNPPEDDVILLAQCAATQHGKNLPPAWRQLLAENRFSAATRQRYPAEDFFPANRQRRKSYVPECFQRAAAPLAAKLWAQRTQPRQSKIDGAQGECDWSKVHAGDWYSADDLTLSVYFWVRGKNGKPDRDERGRVLLMRGQCLLFIDCKSKRVLGRVLIAASGYDALTIRRLATLTLSACGMPRRGFEFEKGMWKKAELLKTGGLFSEMATGFARFGLDVRYADEPNQKIIENVNGLLQALMRGEPGFSSENERLVKNERFERHKREVQSGKVPPEKYFYEFSQWCNRLDEIIAAYNAEVQQNSTVMCGTLSPDEAWRNLQCEPKLLALDGALLPFLASHPFEAKVTRKNGIRWRHLRYLGEATRDLVGRKVRCYLNTDLLDVLVVRHPDTDKILLVPRCKPIPKFDASAEQKRDLARQLAGHNGFDGKLRLYSTMPGDFRPESRLVSFDSEAAELIVGLNDGAKQAEQQSGETVRKAAPSHHVPAYARQALRDALSSGSDRPQPGHATEEP